MPTEKELSEKTEAAIKEVVPKFKVIKKTDSWFHRAIGTILKPINQGYMKQYYTTIGYTVALPEGMDSLPWATAWHEGGHAWQSKKLTRLLFGALYLLGTPVWFVFAALTCWPFFVWLPWWSGVIYLASFLLLSFPPFGFFRAKWEFEMYGLSMAVRIWNGATLDEAYIERKEKQFTTSYYFWMCPYPSYVRKKLRKYRDDAISGEIFKMNAGKYYKHSYATMKKLGLVTAPPKVAP
jgi:hypothetical protein